LPSRPPILLVETLGLHQVARQRTAEQVGNPSARTLVAVGAYPADCHLRLSLLNGPPHDTGKDKQKDIGAQTRNGLSVRSLMTR
jgi:hypothetical protein